jgi:transposase
VQAAVSTLRRPDPSTGGLRAWATRIAARRGKKVAVVALARRLAGILFALLRDGTIYQPRHVSERRATTAPAAQA